MGLGLRHFSQVSRTADGSVWFCVWVWFGGCVCMCGWLGVWVCVVWCVSGLVCVWFAVFVWVGVCGVCVWVVCCVCGLVCVSFWFGVWVGWSFVVPNRRSIIITSLSIIPYSFPPEQPTLITHVALSAQEVPPNSKSFFL